MTQSKPAPQILRTAAILALLGAFSGCASVQYSALEKVGIHKRDILVDRVEDTRDAQTDTRENVVSAYEELSALMDFDGGDLEDAYRRLSKQVERSQGAVEDLDEHLADIDRVSDDLFEEWEGELELYSNAALRSDQEQKLGIARRRYAQMRTRMQTARDQVDPVMAILEDNVLFLKHSLNARALDALRDQEARIANEVDALIREMNIAIEEANSFIARMRGSA